jgi:PhnB protein
MLGVNPYIAFKGNCRDAIEFYKSALDAQVLFTQTFGESPMSGMGPAENIMHCTIKVGDSTIMMCDNPRPDGATAGGNISLAIGLNDPERARQIFGSLAKGGSVVMPLEKTYWAEAFGMLTDKFGIQWMVNCDAPK